MDNERKLTKEQQEAYDRLKEKYKDKPADLRRVKFEIEVNKFNPITLEEIEEMF